jgi:hypothetical protein
MSKILGLDPGYRRSAIIAYEDGQVLAGAIPTNDELVEMLKRPNYAIGATLVVEQVQVFSSNYGVGQEVFDSVFWAGRFVQAWHPRPWDRIIRAKVRGHLGASKGGDAAVRQALIARFGPYKEQAIGTKASPGPLYGVRGDLWSALAIAVTYADTRPEDDGELLFGPEVRRG